MNELGVTKFGLGASVLRKEDDAFITGKGTYTDDKQVEDVLFGFVLRSPYAHAGFEISDISGALEYPGVHLVLTADDVADLNPLPCVTPVKQPDGSNNANRDIPVLCKDTVRHVGDAVAFIVADSLAIAKDASELIEVNYDMLPACVDTAGALGDDAPRVYDDGDGNLAFTHEMGDREKTQSTFANAHHVTTIDIINNRLISNYMETRACLAGFDVEADRYDVTVGSQGVFGQRRILSIIMGIDAQKIHVMTPDVGGGFGTKVFCYREYPLCMVAAKRLGRQVKWTCERGEHFVSDAQGRDNVVTARMAMDAKGRFLAMEVDLLAAMGAYLHAYGPYIPLLGLTMTTGLYDIPVMFARMRGCYTNTVPVDAYRGAGRPEAAYLVERLVDKCAREMMMAPAEIRKLNFIQSEQLPYTTIPGRMYDTGEFSEHMELCMKHAGWDDFTDRAEAARTTGKIRGIGMASYIEACAFTGSEPAFLELRKDGEVDLKIGTQSNGQGHATAYAQIAAQKLGLDYEAINLRQGNTDELEDGGGTGGSRSVPLGGASVLRASVQLAEKIKNLAADQLEASAADIELDGGEARIVGTDRYVTFKDIAASASNADDLKGEGEWKQPEATYPNGTHICEVEIDPETGTTKIITYTIVDDFGVTVNPIMLAGQVHGGVAQGIGQCLTEHVVYDEDGQLITASFMDYAMPRAADMPFYDFHTRNVPSTTNELGIKGAGEAGTIGSCPAVMNAVADALWRRYEIDHIDMPATPHKVWQAIQNAP